MKFVIMCGGMGSKLWPLSRGLTPKHFIQIVGNKTMFQMNVEALLERYSAYDIFVSTSSDLIHFVKEQAPSIPDSNYIVEPRLNKGTGPASCYALARVNWLYPDEIVYYYVQAPIIRKPTDKYLDMIESMEGLVKEYGKLVTGMQIPRYVETGSDLLKLGKPLETVHNLNAYIITEFIDVVIDRMTLEQVTKISNKFSVGTHSNHYTWKAKPFFEAIKKYRPDWLEITKKIEAVFGTDREQQKIDEIYFEYEPGRIELVTKQVMNNSEAIAIEMPYKWAHITTWDDVYRYYQDEDIDLHQTEVLEVGKDGNLVISEHKRVVAIVGLEDLIVVDTPDALLICPRKEVSHIKDLHDNIKAKGRDDLL